MTDVLALSAREIARLVNRQKVSAVEVTKAALARIAETNDQLRAFITVTDDRALRLALRVDRAVRSGVKLPLAGVPLGVKDLFATRDIRTTSGSKIFADHIPDHHATVVERLQAAGAVMVGKCNLHEFAFGFTSINPHYGAARNPWDPSRVSGGGGAAAIAAGLCPIALGSDTGGSIRLPAALCGIVGLKPTYGRVSRHGATTLSWSLDHVGPMTRTVADAALMLQLMAGVDAQDSTSVDESVPNYLAALKHGVKGLRLGIPRNYFFEGADPEVAGAVEGALRLLQKLGAKPVHVTVPHMDVVIGAHRAVIFSEAATFHREWIREHADDYGAEVRANVQAGQFIPAAQYLAGQQARRKIIGEWRELWQTFDVLITPTALIPAIEIDRPPKAKRGESRPLARQYVGNTSPFNLTGQPAISVPCGFTKSDLPIGMQIIGRPFEEELVLRVAHTYEANTDWQARRPQL